MKFIEHTKPFNAEHARAGAPYCCNNGHEAKIIEWVGDAAIGYTRTTGGTVHPAMWDASGAECMAVTFGGVHNLVMTPLGICEGKPVFSGDILNHRDGTCGWEVSAAYKDANFDKFVWPAAAAPVVKTKMSDVELELAGSAAEIRSAAFHEVEAGRRAIANAAIARALSDEQVITMTDHWSSLKARIDELYAQQAEQRAARDMAVAKAVRDELVAQVARYSTGCSTYIRGETDLVAIIATVK